MAIESRVQYALDNFLNPEFFDSQKETYELTENEQSGAAKISLNIDTTDNICVKHYDSIDAWKILREEKNFHMRKSIDHVVLKKNTSGIWELHMFEIKALTTFLGIEISNENIFTYTAYANDEKLLTMPNEISTAKTFKIGQPLIDHKKDEWDANAIYIPLINYDGEEIFTKFKHTKIKMSAAENGIWQQSFILP